MTNYNRPVLAQSAIIDLKGRKVGTEDLRTGSLLLQWAEQAGFRGTDVDIANAVSVGLIKAVELSEAGDHEAAAKQASNCLYVLKKNRDAAQNRRSLGSMDVQCRDGQTRKLGNIVEYFSRVHARMHEQIKAAEEAEAEIAKNIELEALQAAVALIKPSEETKAA